MPDQRRHRHAALDLELGVVSGAGALQRRAGDVGGHNLDAARTEPGAALGHDHRQRIGLLPGRGRRRPEAQAGAGRAGGMQIRQGVVTEMRERGDVTEEIRLVGGHRLDHRAGEFFAAPLIEPRG